jgi:Rrf2 family transcriptional regulator, iron-sulfur cluster assembly transcription factor
MILSKSCEYGIRAVLYLVSLGGEGHVSIRKLSDDLGISFHFLTKIFQRLTEAGLLQSLKGPHGGVRLAKPASTIPIRDLVVAIDGDGIFTLCVLGLPACGRDNPCPLHQQWAPQRSQLETMFGKTSIADLASDINRLGLRLGDASVI